MEGHGQHVAFIWSVADLLRGDYKQSEYGRVILPFTILRRLDCVLEPIKADVLAELAMRENLLRYVRGYTAQVRDIFEAFDFETQVERLAKARLLYLVTEKFANIDLHPSVVSSAQMGAVFEELIRKFAELSNETAGEHFTPRDVIRLMVNLLFVEDDNALTNPGVVRSL